MSTRWLGTQGESEHANPRLGSPWPALDHALQTGIVAVMTLAAAALLVTHQAPVHAGHHGPAHVATTGAVGSILQSHTATLEAVLNAAPPARVPGLPQLPFGE